MRNAVPLEADPLDFGADIVCQTNAAQVAAYDPTDEKKVLIYVLLSHTLSFTPTDGGQKFGIDRYIVSIRPVDNDQKDGDSVDGQTVPSTVRILPPSA